MYIKTKFYNLIFLLIVISSSLIFSENYNENIDNKFLWKKIILTPDIDGDGKIDEITVNYSENTNQIITKLTTKFSESKKITPTTEKIFTKENFGSEFKIFIEKYITYNKNIILSEKKKTEIEKTKLEELNKKEKIKEQNNQISKFLRGKYEYVEYYLKNRPENLTFNYKYKKHSPMDLDEFIFIKKATSIRKDPKFNSPIIKKALYNQKYKVVGKVKVPNEKGVKTEWYEVVIENNLGYVLANSAIALKREFDWHDMIKKIDKTNNFIENAIKNNKTIYVLDDYVPLGGGSGTVKDKFGNRENQSERGYTTPEMKEFINVPDRTLMIIEEETEKYLKVKIDVYNGSYYIKKNVKKLLKDSKITTPVTKFIYIDRKSQNEIVVEKNENSNTWNVVTTSFVTTGKDGTVSFATPYGAFLIAYSKPVMQYTGDVTKEIVGDAKNAIRFSGGGYMHSIPSLFEPKETREQRKAITAGKIGTFAESHKCVRHYDDQIKFIYDWLGNSTPGHKYGYRTPIVPTIVLVK